MQRGDLVLVALPPIAGPSGHEQIGNRPALVVHSDHTSEQLSVIMIVPLTSNLSARDYPHTVFVKPSNHNGLTMPSVILVFQLRAIDKKRIIKKLGVLESPTLDKVTNEIKNLLDI